MSVQEVTAIPAVTPANSCVQFEDVDKVFDGTHALRGVGFTIREGEVHALLGANGAGKSTLIKVLAGFYRPDGGDVRVFEHGKEVGAQKVSFIHQDLALVADLSVAENIALVLGYPRAAGLVSWPRVRSQALKALEQVGGDIDVDANVGELSRADQSLVAIARAVSTDCCALVLDEPTASLPEADVQRLFAIVNGLKARGVSILYVTHRLDEVRAIGDAVTILRDGQVVVDCRIQDITDAEIVSAIAGPNGVANTKRHSEANREDRILELRDAKISDTTETFSFQLARGEILGLAGLRGAGHEDIGRALAGIQELATSEVYVDGRRVKLTSVEKAISHGVGFATSRREQEALAMTLSARENFYLNPSIMRHRERIIGPRKERIRSENLANRVRLRPQTPENAVAKFSGGNQQKVVIGRWLNVDLKTLVLEEPTMGIDVGARAEIYGLIYELADQGLGVIVVSSDFEELAMICSRVLVFDRGQINAELIDVNLTVDNLIQYASGAAKHEEKSA